MTVDFEEHFAPNSIVIAFAGGPQNKFQWGNVLKNLGLNHVLLRDSSQRHYVDGVEGLGTIWGAMKYINGLPYERKVLVGVSSGAYAAIMYGIKTGIDVVAISPITGRGPSTAADFPPQYANQIIDPKQPELDLKPFMRHWADWGKTLPRIRAYISDGPGTELDRGMCERVGIDDITLVPGYSHGDLARGMRNRGMFKEIFAC